MSLTTYGSVAYQLKDANLEATGTCDFVCKAMTIVNRTGKKGIPQQYGSSLLFCFSCGYHRPGLFVHPAAANAYNG